MLGSYGPSPDGKAYEPKFLTEHSPDGMLARGKYNARSRFIDDDGEVYLGKI